MEFQVMDKGVKNLGMFEHVQENMASFSPYNQINEKEFDIILNKIGTFLYLTHNKNINPTTLFLSVMSSDKIQTLFMEMTSTPNIIPILKAILNRYPNLIKSKMLKTKATKIHKKAKKNNKNVR